MASKTSTNKKKKIGSIKRGERSTSDSALADWGAPSRRPIYSLHVDPSGEHLVVGQSHSSPGAATLSVLDAHTGELLSTLERTDADGGSIHRVRFSPDGKWLVYIHQSGADFLLKRRDLSTGSTKVLLKAAEHGMHLGLGFDAEGKRLVVPGHEILILDPGTGKLAARVDPAAGDCPLNDPNVTPTTALSADGRLVAVSGVRSNAVDLHEVPSGKLVVRLAYPFEAAGAMAFDPTGTYLCAADFFSRGACCWTIDGYARVSSDAFIKDGPSATCLSFAPEGRRLAWGLVSGFVEIVDMKSNDFLVSKEFHKLRVNDLCFSADGKFLFTGGQDHRVRVLRL